jgi:Fur family transcriptional regulator, ferric uptake regulator
VAERKAVEEEIRLFHKYLHDNGLKKTHQKELILKTFLKAEGHLSVEDVYELVKKKDRRVGIVTVFRTLKSLAECGIARVITLDDGLTRFEHMFQHPHHHHIVCTRCHKAIEFVSPELERLQDSIVEKYEFKPQFHSLQVHGLCIDCQEERAAGDLPKIDTEKIFARDALRMAIEMEKRSIGFYRSLIEKNQEPGGRQVLEEVIVEESVHLEKLESDLREIQEGEAGLEQAPIFLHFDNGQIEDMIPGISAYEKDGILELDARAALEIATEFERRAAVFFRKYADRFIDTQGKRIFLRFAEDEQQHFGLIHQRMEDAVPSI